MAIGLGTTLRARRRDDGDAVFRSDALAGQGMLGRFGTYPQGIAPAWARIPASVIVLLRRRKLPDRGYDLHFSGDLPVGAGLASSASASVATALAVIEIARAEGPVPERLDDRARLAEICRG